MCSKLPCLAILLYCFVSPAPAHAAPIAVDDSFSVNEDGILTIAISDLIDADFESSAGGPIPMGDWLYLDEIENENGGSDGYPVDGSGRAWNDSDFDISSSTVGNWDSAAAPIQAGGINAFDGAADILGGLAAAGNGENLVTTYLFRNSFTLDQAQAAIEDWQVNLLADDGCAIYINGTEVLRSLLPAGELTTLTLAEGPGNEQQYQVLSLNVPAGLMVAGQNTIAVELHQTSPTSSDAGLDLQLSAGSDGSGGFSYADDLFGTGNPNFAEGELRQNGGFNNTGGIWARSGGNTPGGSPASSAGWSQDFNLGSAATIEISLRYRLIANSGFETDEFIMALGEIDGSRFGNDTNDAIFYIVGNNNGGGDDDSGWRQETFSIPLSAGSHTLDLGVFVSKSTVGSEVAEVTFDDVVLSVIGGGGGGGGVLANDTGDAGSLNAVLVGQPSHGVVVLDPNGTFVYTPAPDFFGEDSFTYQANDNTGNSATATVTVTVDPINDPPTSGAPEYNTVEDEPLSIDAAQGVLASAADIDNDPAELTAQIESNAGNGTVVLSPDGSFSYTPNGDYSGADSFTFRVSDGVAQSEVTTVNLTVAPVDDAPVAVADSYSVDENGQLQVTIANSSGGNEVSLIDPSSSWAYLDDGSDQGVGWIVGNFDDSDWAIGNAHLGYGDGDEATVIGFGPDENNKYATTYFRHRFVVDSATNFGELRVRLIRDDAAAVYLNGSEIIRSNLAAEAAYDTRALSSTGDENGWRDFDIDPSLLTNGLNILAVEVHQHDPDSSDLSFDFSMTGVESVFSGVLANDSDAEGDALDAAVENGPASGTLSLNPDGTFTYTPAPNFFGEDTFEYRVSANGKSSVGSATITVVPGPNDVPETEADSYSVVEDNSLVRSAATGVLANDSDADDDPMSAVLVDNVAHGVLVLAADGGFTYTPTPDFSGDDQFTYRATDPLGQSVETLVSIQVSPVNDAPESVADVFVVQPGVEFSGNVLANDSDADGEVITAHLLLDVSGGSLSLGSNGDFTFDPGAFTGSTTFFYEARDAVTNSSDAQVFLVINGQPSAVADGYSVQEDGVLTVGAAAGLKNNDTDPEGSTLTAILVTDVSEGVLALAGDGSFTYTPVEDFSGVDSFTYVLSDGFQLSEPAQVSINVEAVNDAPVAIADTFAVVTNEAISVSAADGVLENDEDADGDNLQVSLVTDVASGQLVLDSDGSFDYAPPNDFEGEVTFSYRISDGEFDSTASVSLVIAPDINAVVINEIMYHPVSDNDLDEYIEILNTGANPIDLEGWSFGDGVDFTFPQVELAAGGYLVIAADATAFEAIYGVIPNVIGGWTGRLSNSGERIRLYAANGAKVDDVEYSDEGEWTARERVEDSRGWDWNSDHDGGGQSLELILPTFTNKHGQSWAASVDSPTPGAENSVLATEIAPLILDVAHSPVVPRSDEPVNITAELRDDVEGGTLFASLFWRDASGDDPGSFSGVSMADDGSHGDGLAGDGIYGATLPAMPDDTVIEFYVSAGDGQGSRKWPPETNLGQVANAHYQVDDEEHDARWPVYRIVMTGDEDDNFVGVNRGSNERFHATLILDDCSGPVIRYNSSIRVRGAGSRSHNPPPMRVSVPHDRPWNQRTAMNWNTKFTYSQYIGMRLFQGSGMAAPDGKPVRVRWNGEDRMRDDGFDYGLAVHMEVLDGDFASDKYPDDPDGNLYKKVRPDRDWAWRDGDIGDYRSDGWSKETNDDENDWTDLDSWLGVLNNAEDDPDYIAQVESVVDLDQWLRWFGAMAILANGETNASNGADDDFSIYGSAIDGRFQLLPHDLDTILGRGDGSRIEDPQHTIFDMITRGDELAPLVPLFSNPQVRTRYHQALRELLQGTFAKAEFDELVDNSLAGWVPQNRLDDIKTFMDARRSYITGLVDAELGPPPPAAVATTQQTLSSAHGDLMISEVLALNETISHEGGFPDYVELHNSSAGAIDLGGLGLTDDPDTPAKYLIPAGTMIASGEYLAIYSDDLGFGLGANGESIYLTDGAIVVDSVTFGLQIADHSIARGGAGMNTWALSQPTPGEANITATLGDPNGLRINEWLTQPELVFERDFIELYNPSAQPVALGGLAITDEPASEPMRHSLPPLSFIPAGGFALFEAVGNNASAGNSNELPFKLGSDQGWLAISGANGVEIDEVHYLCHRLDVSQGRAVDGGAHYADFQLPTPGFSNTTDLSVEQALLSSLRITEMMYHPAQSGTEFIELRNTGDTTISLGGVEFTDGIDFTFPTMDLAPGAYVLVVENQGAFETAYGTGLNIAGIYSGKLSNGGEHLRLEIVSLGVGIHDFDYDDDWYPTTDGGGFSLEIIDETAIASSWGERQSWRAGGTDGGSPGSIGGNPAAYDDWVTAQFGAATAGTTGKLDDPDDDGVPNVVEFALGGDPRGGQRGELMTLSTDGGFLTITYRRALSSVGLVQLVPQISNDDLNWNSGSALTTQQLLSSDGEFETWQLRDAVPIGVGARRFLRLRVICTDG